MNKTVTGLVAGYTAIIISCSSKTDQPGQTTAILPVKKDAEKIGIYHAGELGFRRTFANIQFMKDEREIERYVERQQKSNPVLVYGDSAVRKRFEALGFVRGNELLQNKFTYRSNREFKIPVNNNRSVSITFIKDTMTIGDDRLLIVSGTDSSATKTGWIWEWKYKVADIYPGDNPELVVLNETYFMNGYNFDFTVYKIITR